MIGEALRMIARRGRDHAASQSRIAEQQQFVERAAFLIGRRELEVLELEKYLRPCELRKRLRMQRRRAHHIARYPRGGSTDVGERDGWREDFCCGSHFGVGP
jgi:hypothetical protein